MAAYNAEASAIAGLVPTFHAAALTDVLNQNDGRVVLYVKNGSGGSINVTIDDPTSAAPVGSAGFNPDAVIAVPATSEKVIGPFPVNRFTESVGLAFSAITTVTWAAIRLPT